MAPLTNAIDAWVREDKASSNYGGGKGLKVKNTASAKRHTFLRFSRPFPLGAQVTEATLTLTLRKAFSGTVTVTAKRVTGSWKENRVTWDTAPAVTGTNSASVAIVDGEAGEQVTIDLAPMLQDVADGGAWHGLRLESNSGTEVEFASSEETADGHHPSLEVEWTEAPDAPTDLAPSGLVVSEALPRLSWTFQDQAGNTEQASAQIQISTVADFSSTEWDSGKFALTESGYDLASSAYGGIPSGASRYWRVRVWDGSDLASGWSDPAQVTYLTQGTLTLQSPSSSVEETTPPVSWTLTGRTQEAYRVQIQKDVGGEWTTLWDTGKVASAATSVSVPPGYIVSPTASYRAVVRVWDTEDRYDSATSPSWVEEVQEFTFARSASITPVSDLTASVSAGSPKVTLEWTYAIQPDGWSIIVDGEEVDQVDAQDLHVSGIAYRYDLWSLAPRTSQEVQVAAVRLDGGVEKHSTANDTETVTTRPTGIWLACREKGLYVPISGKDKAEVAIGSSGATFYPKGSRKPVRVTDSLRGYEGSVSGVMVAIHGMTSQEIRDNYLAIVALNGAAEVRLVMGDLNIPVEIEPGRLMPDPSGGEEMFDVSFAFLQVGEWPMEVKGL